MSENIYEYIKERITARDAAELYGFEVSRNGKMCCPFHQDRHPSAKVDERFHCFVCGIDGDAVDFTARLFNLPSQDAAKKLAADFGISPPGKAFRKKPPEKKPAPQSLVLTEAQFLNIITDRVYDVYCRLFRLLNQWLLENKLLTLDLELRPYYVGVLQFRDGVEAVLDILLYGDAEAKAQIIIEKIGEVNNLERRIIELETRNQAGTN